jgi:hypothetical protein
LVPKARQQLSLKRQIDGTRGQQDAIISNARNQIHIALLHRQIKRSDKPHHQLQETRLHQQIPEQQATKTQADQRHAIKFREQLQVAVFM